MKAQIGGTKGSELHFYIESKYKYGIENELSPLSFAEKEQIDDFLNTWQHKPFKLEMIVYDQELGIAGTIDCIAQDEEGNYYIYDWKTNEDLNKPSFGNKFLEPIQRMDLTSLNTYTLQLSIYKYILEKNLGIDIKGLFVVHFNKKLQSAKTYELQYKKMSVMKMIDSFQT